MYFNELDIWTWVYDFSGGDPIEKEYSNEDDSEEGCKDVSTKFHKISPVISNIPFAEHDEHKTESLDVKWDMKILILRIWIFNDLFLNLWLNSKMIVLFIKGSWVILLNLFISWNFHHEKVTNCAFFIDFYSNSLKIIEHIWG